MLHELDIAVLVGISSADFDLVQQWYEGAALG